MDIKEYLGNDEKVPVRVGKIKLAKENKFRPKMGEE
jgi:hypothetical protein